MTETVGLAWWTPADGGSQQAFVKNYAGLDAAGYEVRAYTAESLPLMVERATEFDWAFVPFVFSPEWVERLAERTHVHLQIGGYGGDDFDAAERAIDAADSVSVLDPQLAGPFDSPGAPWIPNPPNLECFDATDSTEGYVLVPKQAAGGGLGAFRETVEAHPDEEFVVLGSSFPGPPANVTIRPKVPWSWTPEVYAGAKSVVNVFEREGLPNVAYEAFLTATPYVAVHEAGIGWTQAAGEPLVTRIADSASSFLPNYSDHYVTELEDATPEVGRRGRAWVEAWAETGWGWAKKFDAVQEVVDNLGSH